MTEVNSFDSAIGLFGCFVRSHQVALSGKCFPFKKELGGDAFVPAHILLLVTSMHCYSAVGSSQQWRGARARAGVCTCDTLDIINCFDIRFECPSSSIR